MEKNFFIKRNKQFAIYTQNLIFLFVLQSLIGMHAFIVTAFRLLYDTSIDTILYSNCVCFMFVPNLTFNKIIEMSQQKATHKTIFKILYNKNVQHLELYARSLCVLFVSHFQSYRTNNFIVQ